MTRAHDYPSSTLTTKLLTSLLTYSIPFKDQKITNQVRPAPNPMVILTNAVAMRPSPSNSVGDVLAPKTPDKNLLQPYAMGKKDVTTPTCVISMPRALSATITGAAKVNEFRVR